MLRLGLLLLGILVLVTATLGVARSADQVAPPSSPDEAVWSVARSAEVQAPSLFDELGCGACHADLVPSEIVRQRAPSLGYAGAQYQSSYLFEYLQSPGRVRRQIGLSRMPTFHLDERESLALTLYLETLRSLPDAASGFPEEVTEGRAPRMSPDQAERLVREEFGCVSCHTLAGTGVGTALELEHTGSRLQMDWVRRYLADPNVFQPGTIMPALFYQRGPEGSSLQERVPDAGRKLRAIASYLSSLHGDAGKHRDRAFKDAKDRHPDITPDTGARIFQALNCAGCHHETSETSAAAVGPPLVGIGHRLRSEWLRRYLASPFAVRPFGFRPGTGSRMPDFQLVRDEVATILAALDVETSVPSGFSSFAPRSLSVFSRTKADGFLRDKLPCLGCHKVNGEGGRVAPDLSRAGERLNTNYLYAVIADPQRVAPGSVMPTTLMPEPRLELIASFLATHADVEREDGTVASAEAPAAEEERSGYLSLVDHEPMPLPADETTGSGLYATYCAMCHGPEGNGDGYNARYLPVQPTRHADGEYMATRPDDTLFDGIHAGGYVLNRDHRMPAFGQIFASEEIRRLVEHMRTLCDCEGPAWSRDNRARR